MSTHLDAGNLHCAVGASLCHQVGHHVLEQHVDVRPWRAVLAEDWIEIGDPGVHAGLVCVVETVRAEERAQGVANRVEGSRDSQRVQAFLPQS